MSGQSTRESHDAGGDGLGIRAAWQPLTEREAARLEAATGVFEIRGADVVRLIGYAGGRSGFGLRGELSRLAIGAPVGTEFRAEVTSAYLSRWRELLAVHVTRHGGPPPDNDEHDLPRVIGRLGSPNTGVRR